MTSKDGTRSETALIVFTFLLPMSVGLALFGLPYGRCLPVALCALVLAAIGTLASIGHLARPLRAPYSIRHWRSSWLSREILAASAYDLCVLIWCFAAFRQAGMGVAIAEILAVCFGLVLVYAMATAYRVGPMPAWDGWEGLAELAGAICGSGASLAAFLAAASGHIAPLWCVVPMAAGIAVEYYADRARRGRLAEEAAKPNCSATLRRLDELAPAVLRSRWLAISACVFLAVAAFCPPCVGTALAAASFGLEAAAHLIARMTFYAMPVQMIHAPKLRRM